VITMQAIRSASKQGVGPVARRPVQRGVSLIEALVSILVMALGLVGMAALQTHTLKYQQGSVQRGMVSSLMSDYVERVRANSGQSMVMLGTASPYLAGEQTWEDAAGVDWSTVEAATDCAGSTSCEPADRAEYELVQWQKAVRQSLPNGSVSMTTMNDASVRVTLMWSDKAMVSGAGENQAAVSSKACADGDTGAASLNCCPASVAAADGVRCANMVVVP